MDMLIASCSLFVLMLLLLADIKQCNLPQNSAAGRFQPGKIEESQGEGLGMRHVVQG
jgi:hypothetical protein